MIPAGVEPVDAAGVARMRGVSLGALRNSGLLRQPSSPTPLNAHRERDLVWDPADIRRHMSGLEPLPRVQESPDDLLDDAEAAALVGVSVETFRSQVDQLDVVPRRIRVHNLRYWRRGDLSQRYATPPGRPGKPEGAKDLSPRKKRGSPAPVAVRADRRAAELADYLAGFDAADAARPEIGDLAERFGVSRRTIQRWLARI